MNRANSENWNLIVTADMGQCRLLKKLEGVPNNGRRCFGGDHGNLFKCFFNWSAEIG